MKETNTFVKAIRFTLLTVMLLLVSQRVKCQPSNNNALSPRQIDFSILQRTLRSLSVRLHSLHNQQMDGKLLIMFLLMTHLFELIVLNLML